MLNMYLTREQEHGICPNCDSNWDNGAIFDHFRENNRYEDITDDEVREMVKKYYGDEKAHFSKLIGIEDPTIYDGCLYWQCPDCNVKIPRWSEKSPLFGKAVEAGARTWEEIKSDRQCEKCGYKGKGACACQEA
jgi:rubredoxin